MKYWVISDPHFGHDVLVKKGCRPEGHEELIMENLFKKVEPDDILICLGDIAFYKKEYWHGRLIKFSSCTKILIRGNHDKETLSRRV